MNIQFELVQTKFLRVPLLACKSDISVHGGSLEVTLTVHLPIKQWFTIQVNKKEAENLPKLSPPPPSKPETQVQGKYTRNPQTF